MASSSTQPPAGSSAGPIYFWRETEDPYGFLSQWYEYPFVAPCHPKATRPSSTSSTSATSSNPDPAFEPSSSMTTTKTTTVFNTTEQYMMYHKAILFSDFSTAHQILQTSEPRKQKALGRKVSPFDGKVWEQHRERIVEEGNWWKFTGGVEKGKEGEEALGTLLVQTGERGLVEASPYDRIWGIGFKAADAGRNKGNWGENLLGKALERVRERLRASKSGAEGKGSLEG